MSDNHVLFEVLRRFARTMTGRYDITDVLYELCDHVVEVLDATAAGVALLDDEGQLRFVTATNEVAVAAEQAQERGQTGPCYSSIEERRPVAVGDIRDHSDQWPDYCDTVEHHGLEAVLGLPLVLGDERIGSLDVYDRGPRDWSADEVEAASVLADIAAAYVLNASELARSRRTTEQLQQALDSRVVIEQAKGKLAALLDVPTDEAFALLRQHARSNSRRIHDVARDVLERGAEVVAPE